ncbi:AAA family ATPase [Aliarcobacter cryaerophilus]|uniref:AAA family ATPase n=1 Tax=Aliarcobacter cryaerophilus TaxID=28198 RepID=UPI00164A44B9|nr:AAA family ATPase [Aliarcobacter cryaerophilus]QNK84597.1 AAA family ATPase [Aliarcobacter cryaerophilus]
MSINKSDIEKYIFDPNNPRLCKSYNLLLNIAKKEPHSFISPEFLMYFYKNDIFTNDFKNHLWDIPKNYESLSEREKIELFENQLSYNELRDYINNLNIKTEKILKYKFLQIQKEIQPIDFFYKDSLCELSLINDISTHIKVCFLKEDKKYEDVTDQIKYDFNHIIISKNYFGILRADILRSSIFITLEENIDKFLNHQQKNVKPIFLKKIEDIDLLLSVLNQDLKQTIIFNQTEEISYIKSINIKDFYSIKNISLENLENKKEIYILGENGDGKSLFLQALTVGLKGVEEGDVFNLVKSQKEHYELKIEDSNSNTYDSNDKENVYKNLFAYGANRNNNCQMKEDESGYLTIFNPSWDLKNPIEWLKYLDHSEKSGKTNIVSVEAAKKLLQELLNSDVQIDITPETVTFKEKGSLVTFEQLSAGYKGVITIITDLLVRLSENQPNVVSIHEFKGIVLIDEVELHLHPKWKYNFVKRLRDIFPNIQFIMTTHSPTVLLGASKEAVFYKIYKEDGEVKISNQMPNEGYTNNSLISSPLFDLETITSRDYDKTISSDDYIYDKIHQRISEKLKDNINMSEEEILKLIDKELDAL